MPAPLTTATSSSPVSVAARPQVDAAAQPAGPVCSNSAAPCFTWQSADLLQGGKRVHIAHNGSCYQLQTTRQGKLILTK
ncbi:MAG: hemin uptake protein HemP [Giesbergeria sp.]|nr:hemin uptake protein HemP [Simplicispira sp.]